MMFKTIGKNRNKSNFLKVLQKKSSLSSLFKYTAEINSTIGANSKFLESKWKYYLKNSLNENLVNGAGQYYKTLKQGRKRNGGRGKMRPAKDCPMRIGRRKKSQTKIPPNQRRRSSRREPRPPIRLRKLQRKKKKKKDDKRRKSLGIAM
ncbi:hypothetical protein TNCV_3158101 [Trichonephila clavipes]|nr:hypothetical protein TNCV_3158101 [Trichonephila clavipes]